jgi:AraC-like DNA-binding protein
MKQGVSIMAVMTRQAMQRRSRGPNSTEEDIPALVRDGMTHQLLRPDARLRDYVRCYFVVKAERHPTFRDELLLPDGDAELVFNFGAGFDRWRLGQELPRASMQRSYCIGARTHSVITRDWGNLSVIGVKLDPRFLRSIIRQPLIHFSDTTLTLNDLNNKSLLELENALTECSMSQVAHVLDRFFMRELRAFASQERDLDHLIRRINSERGVGTVSHWIRGLGSNMRTLERRFAAWMGMSPKAYARIIRFKHSYRCLMELAKDKQKVAADAYLDGYYDQSHFHKEFKHFTGTSPLAMLASNARSSLEVTDQFLEPISIFRVAATATDFVQD